MANSIEKVREFLEREDVEKGLTLLSTEYTNVKTPLLFKCNYDGTIFERNFNNLSSRKRFYCPKCGKKIASQKRCTGSIDIVKQYLSDNGYNPDILLSTEYISKKSPLKFRCEQCSEIFERNFDNLGTTKYKNLCKRCASRQNMLYTEEEVRGNLLKDGIVLVGTYTSAHDRVKCICPKGHEFDLNYSNYLYKKHSCPTCAIINISGENSPAWKGGITQLHKELRTLGTKKWRERILKEGNYTCDITGSTQNLEVHHLNTTFHDIMDKIYEENNITKKFCLKDYSPEEMNNLIALVNKAHEQIDGVVLRKDIHTAFHKQYGYYNNTKEQYLEFKNSFVRGKTIYEGKNKSITRKNS